MKEIKYFPNICLVLGIDLEQPFNIKGIDCNPCRIQDNTYYVVDKNNEVLHAEHLIKAINNPSLIEKIEYNDEQKEIFKALKTLGYNYIARDSDYSIYAYEKKPTQNYKYYWSSEGIVSFELETEKILNKPHLNFIDWSDEEPFEIPEV